jgi:hypothetical protein
MAYQYRGTVHDVEEPTPILALKHDGFDPSACGTYAGYRRHQKWDVPACQGCKDAMAAYTRSRYVPAPPKVFNPDACGTWAGFGRHQYHGVPPCEPCREASRVYQRAWRASRKKAA